MSSLFQIKTHTGANKLTSLPNSERLQRVFGQNLFFEVP